MLDQLAALAKELRSRGDTDREPARPGRDGAAGLTGGSRVVRIERVR
jgi:hypothetical protein